VETETFCEGGSLLACFIVYQYKENFNTVFRVIYLFMAGPVYLQIYGEVNYY
jgi:hypothetical protein